MKPIASLTYKRRNQLLLLGAVVFFVLAYQVSIRPTLRLWQENESQRTMLQQLRNAPQAIRRLQAQKQQNQWLMRSFQVDTTQSEGLALNRLTATCRRYGVTVASLSPSQHTVRNGYSIETRIAKLRGSFHGLVQTVYSLEYVQPIGRLSSVRYALEEDRKQHRSFLYAYLYVQTIVQEKPAG
ncbi:hypothetical protein [Hymenobacter lucidus]|uniref:General secretion pathway protein n=1 Tax=Hymenobacter lucidus TaxID=2880930 RepID=A0ABS8AZG4_9BACT|nr:hypothetical protein [Hymenobacter lucidus]MCB2411158.1 hypothetical protein [Hymenobacter lucidus]